MAFLDLTGQRFGRLIALRRAENGKRNKARWLCRCDCGNEVIALTQNLRQNCTKSCGCWNIDQKRQICIERNLTHGQTRSPEYRVWSGMMSRCYNPKVDRYPRYGGRGIKVCDRWRESFPNFLADMGPRPSPSHSIERNDTNGDYEPSNCRWATAREQSNNTRRSHRLTFRGETLTISQWERKLGMPRDLIGQRINKLGWSVEDALTQPSDWRPLTARF